jgi:serine protease Do
MIRLSMNRLMAIVAGFTLLLSTGPSASAQAAKLASTPSDRNDILRQYDESVDALAQQVLPAVVQIEVTGFGARETKGGGDDDVGVIERQRAIGSGVIVDPDGYIMTNAHVVNGAQRIRVIITPTPAELVAYRSSFLNRQRTFEAKLIGVNRLVDLALIKIEEKNLPYIPLKNEFRIQLGQMVLAVGSPEGLEHTVTRGIVSAVGRQIDPDRPMVYIQTDAPINPGNSGGALVDRDGNLVGLNTFIYTEGGGSEGLGFAIPEPAVRFAYQEFKEHGRIRRTEIGANAQTITPDLAAGLRLPQDWGVIISDVVPAGPSDKAGLKAKDIVLSMDGRPIDSLPKFTISLYLHRRGQQLQMQVLRGKENATVSIAPIDVPNGVERLSDLIDPQKSLISPLGVFLLDLTPSIAGALPDLRSSAGVVVAARVDYEPLISADLNVGDVIRSINGQPVKTIDELRSRLSQFKPAEPVVMEVERQGVYQFVSFEME